MQKSTYIPHLHVHPTSVIISPKSDYPYKKTQNPVHSHLLVSKRKHKNHLSPVAARKIRKACTYLYATSTPKPISHNLLTSQFTFKISFITLTLSSKQIHPDKIIVNSLLNQFIVEAKKRWKVEKYIWRAEKQKNGNIHFHILTDKFISWNEIRNVWNRIQNKLGYIDRYREEMVRFHQGGFKERTELLNQWSYKNQIKAYQTGKANDWSNPNSTDIHSLKFVKNIEAYLIKYLTKQYQNENITSRLWSCSNNLSHLVGGRDIYHSAISDEIKRLKLRKDTKYYEADYFTVIRFAHDVLNPVDYPFLWNLLNDFLILHFTNTT